MPPIAFVHLIHVFKPETALIYMTVPPVSHPGTQRSLDNIGWVVQADVAFDIYIVAGVQPRTVFLVLLIQSEGFLWADDNLYSNMLMHRAHQS